MIEGSIPGIAGNENFTLSNPNFIGIHHTVGDDLAFFPLVPDFHAPVDFQGQMKAVFPRIYSKRLGAEVPKADVALLAGGGGCAGDSGQGSRGTGSR